MKIYRKLFQPESSVTEYIQTVIRNNNCRTGLDIGCGRFSNLTSVRPQIISTGIDAFAASIEDAKRYNLHDNYILSDVMQYDFNGQKFDVVIASEVIEHFDKWDGLSLIKRMEQLATKLVIITTPNGFLIQGPEFNNPWQRHKSGWFVQDFLGLGYKVHGIFGPKFMRGYANEIKWRGARVWTPVSQLIGRLIVHWPACHAALLAIKDIEGVQAQLKK
jgi:hypothetical protein